MATFSTLQDDVEAWLIDAPARTVARIPRFINMAQKTIQRKHNFKAMEAEISLQVTADATRNLVAIPARFKEFRDVPYLTRNTRTVRELDIGVSKRDLLRSFTDDQEGEPRAIFRNMETGFFEIWPLPDGLSDFSGGEYRVSIPYWTYVADLSAAGDTNWFVENAEKWLIFQAVAEGFFFNEDEQRGTIWTQKAAGEYAEVVTADKRQILAQTDTLVPLYQGVRQPRIR